MRNHRRSDRAQWKIAVAILVLWPLGLAAQRADSVPAGGFEAWGGIANHSPQWGILGETPGLNFGQVAFRWSRAVGRHRDPGILPAVELTFDVIPLVRVSPPLISLRGTGTPCATATLCVARPPNYGRGGAFPDGSPYGFGISPFGVARRFHRAGVLSGFVGGNVGAVMFDHRVPTTQSSAFNFTAVVEAGVRLGRATDPGLTVTYRFHHLSNAKLAGENPGLASHLVTIGIHRPRVVARPESAAPESPGASVDRSRGYARRTGGAG